MDILAGTPYEHLDPSTELAPLDVVKLLTEYCNKVVASCLRDERKDVDESFKEVYQQLGNVTESLIGCIKTHETKINDLDLKIDTISSYLEHLVYGLKKGLQEAFCLVLKDMEFLFTSSVNNHHSQNPSRGHLIERNSSQLSCDPCGLTFSILKDLQKHVKEKHEIDRSLSNCYACSLCDNLFPSVANLESHVRCFHGENSACRCLICDHIFRSPSDLSIHIQNHHRTNHPIRCQRCESNFLTVYDLDTHLCNVHRNIETFSDPLPASHEGFECEICPHTFDNFNDLSEHVESSHTATEFYPCDTCEKSFGSMETLEVHINNDHRLAQLDGPIQELFDFAGPPNHDSVRTKAFALNKARQINDIRKDSKIADFDVTVNNQDENCTIKCSSGFYIQVAQSCFTTLKENTVLSVGGIVISISNITKSNDKSGSEVNRLVKFAFVSQHQNCGGVAVHLHHSTRTIQVQGCHKMPDNSKAALWFVKNVIVKKFEEQAKAKKFAIKNFNDSVQRTFTNPNAVPNPSNSCRECSLLFNTRSKPSMCSSCSVYFHKTCLKDHAKTCSRSSSPNSNTESVAAPTTTANPVEQRSSSIGFSWPATASTSGTQTVPPLTSGPDAGGVPGSSMSSIPGLRTLVSFIPDPTAIPEPPAPACTKPPSPDPPPAPGPLSQASGSRIKDATKKKTKAATISNDDTNLELIRRELTAAQARIVQLDATVVDKEQQVEILLARVKVLEDDKNKQVYDKYFPSAQQTPVTQQTSVPSHSNSSSHHCLAHQCCQTSRHCCCHLNKSCHISCQTPTTNSSCLSPELILKFEKQVERIKSEIDNLKAATELLKVDQRGSKNNNGDDRGDEASIDRINENSPPLIDPHKPSNEYTQQICSSPASMCSIEEFFPENPMNQSNLNL